MRKRNTLILQRTHQKINSSFQQFQRAHKEIYINMMRSKFSRLKYQQYQVE